MTFNTIRQPAYLLLLLCSILSFASVSVSAEEAALTKKVSGEDAGAKAGAPASKGIAGSGSGKYTQDEIFNSLDTNHDSKFDLKDFYVLDQNHDGKITKSEVTSQFSGAGASASAGGSA
eukprot:757767_1